jgi:hypothetical protein
MDRKNADRRQKGNSEPLTAGQEAELRDLIDRPVDTTDIPEMTDWSGGRRATCYRPIKTSIVSPGVV